MRAFLALMVGAMLFTGCAQNPAADLPEGVVESPGTPSTPVAATTPAGEVEVLPLSPESKIGFVGSKVTGSHDGGFEKFDGAITLVDRDPEKSRVEVTIDMTTAWADDDDLTDHLHSADFFEVDKYPTSTFRSTRIVKSDKGYAMTGELTLHGVTKTITFPAEIQVSDSGVNAQAEFFIKRFDWGIKYPGKADNLIRDEVVIKLDLKTAPAESGKVEPPSPVKANESSRDKLPPAVDGTEQDEPAPPQPKTENPAAPATPPD